MIKGLRSPIILPDLPQLIPLLNFLIWQALNSPVSAVMRCFFSSQSFSNSSWTCKMKDSRESSNSPTNPHLVLPWGSSSLSRCSLLVKQLFYTSLFKRDAKNQLILLKLFLVVLMVYLVHSWWRRLQVWAKLFLSTWEKIYLSSSIDLFGAKI